MFFCSEIAPLLKQDKVCDLIVKAMRQNQHELVIPKALKLSVILSK
jgi:hypothetical protein